MARGIFRKFDELGRITIPKEYRTAIGAGEKNRLGMYLDKDIIHLFLVEDDFIGFSRNLDELGRWTVPIEVRRTLNCGEGQEMDIYVDHCEVFEGKRTICIRKIGCSWCDNTHNLIEVKGHVLCHDCAIDVADEIYRKKIVKAI